MEMYKKVEVYRVKSIVLYLSGEEEKEFVKAFSTNAEADKFMDEIIKVDKEHGYFSKIIWA